MRPIPRCPLIVILALLAPVAGLSACGKDRDVCGAQKDAHAACSWVSAPLASCEASADRCKGSDQEKWVERFECLSEQCDQEVPQLAAEEACSYTLEGVSWDCSPTSAHGL